MRTVAVLPVKRFSQAKQRLRAVVDGHPRERLAQAMVADVLGVLAEAPGLEAIVVVTAEPHAAALAWEHGARAIGDPDEAGHSPAAELGIREALEAHGAERVLLVPGDTPALHPVELAALLAREEPVVIVPDRHGTGTNALLLSPPDAITPAFGPDSRRRHEHAARAAELRHLIYKLPSLMLDVDTPADLAALRERGVSAGSRTRDVL